jgi:hypothetical protein
MVEWKAKQVEGQSEGGMAGKRSVRMQSKTQDTDSGRKTIPDKLPGALQQRHVLRGISIDG